MDSTTLAQYADDELLRRMPLDLAAYYQALPLALEEGRVTVVTSHPTNRAAIQVLARLLEAEVVPVAGSESDVASAIDRLYPPVALHRQVLSWSGDPSWRARVRAAASLYATVLGLPVTHLDGDTRAPGLPTHPVTAPGTLLVCPSGDDRQLAALMQQTTASLLLVRGDARPPQRLLIALRGYGSDRAALRQTRPLLTQGQAAVTVLPLANGQAWQPDRLLAAKSPARLHLLACLRDLGGLPITVRLRPGDPTDQLITELSAADYDLLVIAAEAWGDFVRHALAHIQAAGVLPDQPVLIVRPPIVAGPHPSAPDGAPLEGQ
jgi:hypothetical protein